MLTIAELAGRRLRDDALGAAGAPAEPLVVVDLASDPGDVAAAVDAVRWLSGRSAVVVGMAHGPPGPAVDVLVDALDLTLAEDGPERDRRVVAGDAEAALARVASSVARCPVAAISLCGVLRATSALPVEAGLLVESFAYSTLLAGPEHAAWLADRRRDAGPRRDSAAVRVERSGERLSVTLDRPERRNAYGRQMRDELVQALTLLDLDDSIAEVDLRGAGPAFCSGGDLEEFGCLPDAATAHVIRSSRSAAALLHRHRERVHAHVHGACIGAGAELPAFAGRVTAASDAWFQLPELSMGLIPGAGGTVSITRRIGRWRTALLALTGDRLPAQTAVEWGLADQLAAV